MNIPDLDISLLAQLPPWYREVLDYQEIMQTEQESFDLLAQEINAVGDNLFFQTMDSSSVAMWESVFGIIANPTTETLDFRRIRILNRISTKPPYTMAFLRQKLDELIGPGNWTVTMDYPNYTLYVESSAKNQQYATEVAITIGKIKPAHIVYINEPLITNGIQVSEEIDLSATRWNYRLNGSWALNGTPFRTIYSEEVIKLPSTPSIQPLLLSGVAGFVSGDVVSARINGSIVISALTKSVSGSTLTVTYDVSAAQTGQITSVELLDANGGVLTSTSVYVPVNADGVIMKHTIPVKEGV